jgi:PPOX class probable FMN-dependent enzyme
MQINTIQALRSIYDEPAARVIRKDIGCIDEHIGRFIELSPFMVMASTDAAQQLDASPRGGAPGFVKILDKHTLLVPDSAGNNRLDTLENILAKPQVGLLFMIPGVEEMARVNGRAALLTDRALLDRCVDEKRRPKLVIQIKVQEAYLHCAKAVMRSHLWDQQVQVDRAVLPSMGEMIKAQLNLDGPAESREEMRKRYLPTL